VLGHGWLADAELSRNYLYDGPGWMLAGGQQFQDATPNRITEDVQGVHDDKFIDLSLYKSMPIFGVNHFNSDEDAQGWGRRT
jgi:hypothetical protein